MSYLVPREIRETHPLVAHSPSLESVLSEITELSREWVLFGPEASESSDHRIDSSEDDQFELPGHRMGDFDSINSGNSALDRVHQWSSEQSRLVFEELGRLEQRFLWHRQQPMNPEPEDPPSSWDFGKLASTVHNLIALDDQVLELLFASCDQSRDRDSHLDKSRPPYETPNSAFARSKREVPQWDEKVVECAFKRIGVRPTWWFLRLLWRDTKDTRQEEPPTMFPQNNHNLWDEVSSMSTEVY